MRIKLTRKIAKIHQFVKNCYYELLCHTLHGHFLFLYFSSRVFLVEFFAIHLNVVDVLWFSEKSWVNSGVNEKLERVKNNPAKKSIIWWKWINSLQVKIKNFNLPSDLNKKKYTAKLYVSLQLCVQNVVSAQPCVGKLGISLVLFNFLDCNFRLWFKTP